VPSIRGRSGKFGRESQGGGGWLGCRRSKSGGFFFAPAHAGNFEKEEGSHFGALGGLSSIFRFGVLLGGGGGIAGQKIGGGMQQNEIIRFQRGPSSKLYFLVPFSLKEIGGGKEILSGRHWAEDRMIRKRKLFEK